MKEAAFNSSLVKELKKAGLYAMKIADRFNPGIPDIYVTRGIWIECKIIKCNGKRIINVWNKLRPEQRIKMQELHDAGDDAYIVIRWETEQLGTFHSIFDITWLYRTQVVTPESWSQYSRQQIVDFIKENEFSCT